MRARVSPRASTPPGTAASLTHVTLPDTSGIKVIRWEGCTRPLAKIFALADSVRASNTSTRVGSITTSDLLAPGRKKTPRLVHTMAMATKLAGSITRVSRIMPQPAGSAGGASGGSSYA